MYTFPFIVRGVENTAGIKIHLLASFKKSNCCSRNKIYEIQNIKYIITSHCCQPLTVHPTYDGTTSGTTFRNGLFCNGIVFRRSPSNTHHVRTIKCSPGRLHPMFCPSSLLTTPPAYYPPLPNIDKNPRNCLHLSNIS